MLTSDNIAFDSNILLLPVPQPTQYATLHRTGFLPAPTLTLLFRTQQLQHVRCSTQALPRSCYYIRVALREILMQLPALNIVNLLRLRTFLRSKLRKLLFYTELCVTVNIINADVACCELSALVPYACFRHLSFTCSPYVDPDTGS